MTRTLTLPCLDGTLAPFTLSEPRRWAHPDGAVPHARRVRGGARRGRSAARRRRVHRERDRLGRDARLPPAPVEVRLRDRRSDGHRAARRRTDLEVGAGADQAVASRREGRGRNDRLRRGDGSPRTDAGGDARRRAARVRGAGRLRRGRRRARDPHGEPRARQGGALGGRLSRDLRRRAAPGDAAGDPALARRHVRPAARRLLGHERSRRSHGGLPRCDPGASRQGGRDQDLAARCAARDRHAAAAAGRRAHVHGRRLQLRRADRGRRAAGTATRCSASSTASRRRRRSHCRRSTPATSRRSAR